MGFTGIILTGCSSISPCTVICRDPMITQGQQAYLNREYTLSRKIFSQLALRKDDSKLQAAGLYGNVCLDMILAENAQDFRNAVAQLLLLPLQLSCRIPQGMEQGPAGLEIWQNIWATMHPGMIEKALAHGMALLASERSGLLQKLNDLYAKQEVYKKERVGMQEKIDSLGPRIAALEKQNIGYMAQITDLLYQITVLEKIDKERQEQRETQ
ncbi:hypothetical protein [uncultured Desulfobacter sp.]|uniref:hypothetical protein n=1 Tax=uncultured Desulfobacter sp. TaxID=240139 RepID=UPI002AAC2E22|nr:hypothetical protein [uncultured Desulfobacter sp.]